MRYILCTKSNAFLSINLCPEAAQSDLIKIDGIYINVKQNNKIKCSELSMFSTVEQQNLVLIQCLLKYCECDLEIPFAVASSRHAHSTKFFGKPLWDGSPETLFILGVLPFRRLWATLWSRAFAWLLRHRHHSLHDASIRMRPHSNLYLLFH